MSYCNSALLNRREVFAAQTAKHRFTVIADHGPYKHWSFAAPNSVDAFFDIVLWPGHLTLIGDLTDAHTFIKVPADLTQLHLRDPLYWTNKLSVDRRRDLLQFDLETFRTVAWADIDQFIADNADDPAWTPTAIDDLKTATWRQIYRSAHTEDGDPEALVWAGVKDWDYTGTNLPVVPDQIYSLNRDGTAADLMDEARLYTPGVTAALLALTRGLALYAQSLNLE